MNSVSLNGNSIPFIWFSKYNQKLRFESWLQVKGPFAVLQKSILCSPASPSQHQLLGKSLAIFQGRLLAVYEPFTNQRGTCPVWLLSHNNRLVVCFIKLRQTSVNPVSRQFYWDEITGYYSQNWPAFIKNPPQSCFFSVTSVQFVLYMRSFPFSHQ